MVIGTETQGRGASHRSGQNTPELGSHERSSGKDTDDRVIIARHSLMEGAAQSVHREGPRHVQGLARRRQAPDPRI